MKKTEQQLSEIIRKARNELSEIEDKRHAKEALKHVGKCYRYRNSSGPDDHWWLYMKAIGTDGRYLVTFAFEKCLSNNEWRIKHGGTDLFLSGYSEITEGEFNKQWAKCLAELNSYK